MGVLSGTCTMNCGLHVRVDVLSGAPHKDLAHSDELWNEGLARFGGTFLAGVDFSTADAFFAPVAFRIQSYGCMGRGGYGLCAAPAWLARDARMVRGSAGGAVVRSR